MCDDKQAKKVKSPNRPGTVKQIIDTFKPYKADYIFWRFCPEAIMCSAKPGCTFAELKKAANMPDNFTKESCELWLLDENVQSLVRQLLKAKNTQQLLELHQIYFDKAKSDPKALSGLLQLNEVLFNGEKENELTALLSGISDDVINKGKDNG